MFLLAGLLYMCFAKASFSGWLWGFLIASLFFDSRQK